MTATSGFTPADQRPTAARLPLASIGLKSDASADRAMECLQAARGLGLLPLLDEEERLWGALDATGLAQLETRLRDGASADDRWLRSVALPPPPAFDLTSALEDVGRALALDPHHPFEGWLAVTDLGAFRGVARVVDVLSATLASLRAAQHELVESREKLARARRNHGDFLISLGHDMRTPLSGVVGGLDLLQTTAMTHEQNDLVAAALTAAEVMVNLVGDVVDMSRMDAGEAVVGDDEIAPAELLESVMSSWRDRARSQNLAFDHHVEPDVPALVSGDRTRLHRVLATLVGNAVRASELGSVFVLTRARPFAGEPGLEWLVLDTGPPLGEGSTPPHRDDAPPPAVGRQRGGNGVGLSVVHRSVDLLGGVMAWDAGPEGGGAFSVHLPVRVLSPAPPRGLPDLAGRAILLVGDDRPDCREAERVLARGGARVIPARGALARDVRDGPPIGLVIVADGALPEDPRDWHWLAAAKRPIILLAHADTPRTRRRAHVNGIHFVLARPAGHAALLHLAATAIDRKGVATDASRSRPAANASLRDALRRRVGGQPILVIDDTAMNRTVLGRQLAKLGFEADLVADGQSGLELLARRDYGLVLLDLAMPGMDGFEFTTRRRADEAGTGRRVPIVAITAHALRDYVERGITLGMDDYLTKPVTLERLAETLRRWLPVVSDAPEPGVEGADAAEPAGEAIPAAGAIDLAALGDLVGEMDMIDAEELLTLYLRSIEPTLDELTDAVERQDRAAAARAAHAAAIASLNSGAHRLGHWLREIEAAAPFADWSHLAILAGTVAVEHEQVRRFVTGMRPDDPAARA